MILAVAFLNPLLLGGLGLSVLPIVIHLLSRRQFRRIEWGATRFLLEAEKENRRRVRFEQWLLVALRCLAMSLLALLIARPYVQPGVLASLLGGQGEVHRILVIDDSPSLGYRGSAGQEFAVLRDAAVRLLAWIRQETGSDPISVYRTSQPDAPLLERTPLTDATLDELRVRITELRPCDVPARPRRLLETIAGNLSATGHLARADLYLLSDFQRSEWLAFDAAAQSVFEPLRSMGRGDVRVVLLSAASPIRENTAVVQIGFERFQTVAGLPAMVTATVANYTRQPLRDVRLQVETDGAASPTVAMDQPIEPGQTRAVTFEVTFPDEGHRVLTVGLSSGDNLAIDDTRRMATHVKPAIVALLVNGQPSSDPLRDEVHLLRSALAPPGPFSSGIRVDVIDPPDLESVDLRRFDCVWLCNVPPPGDAAAAALREYVETGGGLLVFLGEEVGDAVEFNRALYAGGSGVLPAPLEGPPQRAASGEGFQIVRSEEHPVTAAFPGGASVSEYVRFRSFYRCIEDPGPASAEASPTPARPPAVVLARFTDAARSAALIERSLGRGRTLLFTSSVDLDWNDWARSADGSYVVAMLELAQYAARRSDNPPATLTGEPIEVVVPADEYEMVALVKPPDYPERPPTEARARDAGGTAGRMTLVGPIAMRSGTYTVELMQRGLGPEPRPVCANIHPAESDLSVARPAELIAALAPIPAEFVQAADSFLPSGEQTRRELWPSVLLALVTVLMLEQTLAWRFGTPWRGTARK